MVFSGQYTNRCLNFMNYNNHFLNQGVDVDITCQEYENGTALHIAASNLSLEAAKVLIGFDSDPHLKDELARTPIDCIPDEEEDNNVADIYDNVSNMIDRRRKTR